MKLKIKNKFFILLFGFCIIVNYVRAQTQISCDPIWISTDPSNPINPQKPSASNYFNWMLTPSSHSYTCYPGSTGTPYPIESPFYETSININYHSLVNFANSDFFPQDGWELFKQNLGQYNNCSSFRQNIVVVPYIMLYNKYTGIMRLFGSLTDPSLQNYATVIVHVYEAIPDPTHGLNIGWNASSFLSPHGVLNQPLDQKTTVLNVQVPTKFGNDQNTMFYADFVVGYDPCVCHYPSTIDVDFDFITTATVSLTGTSVLQTVNNGGNNKVVTEITDGVAAMVSLGTSLASGTFGFTSIPAWTKFLTDAGVISSSDAQSINFTSTLANQGVTLYKAYQNSDATSTDTAKASASNANAAAAKKSTNTVSTTNSMVATSTATAVTNGVNSGASTNSTIKLTGSTSSLTNFYNGDFEFSTPGSEHSDWNDEENDGTSGPYGNGKDQPTGSGQQGNILPEYPAYNEILGTMALLQTPSVERFDSTYPDEYTGDQITKTVYKITSDPVFAFNPIMNMDPSKTKIKVALYLRRLESNDLWEFLVGDHVNFSQAGNTNDYITPFVDIGCAQDLITMFRYYDDNPNFVSNYYELDMKFEVFFVSTDIGRNGEPNNSNLVFTYPVNVTSVSSDPLNTPPPNFADLSIVPDNIRITSPVYYTHNAIIRANDLITIDAALTAAPGVHVRIVAGQNFKMTPNGSVGIGIDLEIGSGFLCTTTVAPQTHDFVNNYCDGTVSGLSYNAYQVSTSAPEIISKKNFYNFGQFTSSIYPNPAYSTATLNLNLSENNELSMDIIDITGKVVSTAFQNKTFAIGSSQTPFDVSDLKSGVYFCKIYNENTNRIEKLVIVDK